MAVLGGQLFDPELNGARVRKVPNKDTQTKARASLPDVLALKEVAGQLGIFTKLPLTRATQFGPLEAPLVAEAQWTVFPLKLDESKFTRPNSCRAVPASVYHAMTNEDLCNWMMFVRPAKFFAEQNLCAHQLEESIYYTTTRDIPPGEELKVWYSPTYAKFMSARVLTAYAEVGNASRKVNLLRRTQGLTSDRDVWSVPPKKRGWQRGQDKGVDFSEENFMLEHFGQVQEAASAKPVVKPHVCPICSKSFKDKTKLKIHSVTHSDQRNFLCHQCGATFKRKDKLNGHLVNAHSKVKAPRNVKEKAQRNIESYPFKCVDCNLGFVRRGMLIVHLNKKHPDVSTNSVEELARPTYKTVWDFPCPYCDKVYKSSTKRKLHIRKLHPGRELPPSLRKPKGETSSRKEMARAIEKTVQADPVPCPYCDRQYTVRHKRDKHVREKHPGKRSSENSASDLPPVYDVEPGFADIEERQLAADNPVDSDATPMYSVEQVPNPHDAVEGDVYCTQNANQRRISNELAAHDRDMFLIHAMSDLEPGTSDQRPRQFQDFQPAPPKESSYSRYHLGRKRMLRSYEDSQNQQVPQNLNETAAPQPGKQMPYKARLLGPEAAWRSENWHDPDHCGSNSVTDLGQSSEPNNNDYHALPAQQSLVSMLDSHSDESLLLGDTRPGHDGTVLNDPDMHEFDYPTTPSWMYQ